MVRVLGQGSYGMVKLAYNREDDKNYVSVSCRVDNDPCFEVLMGSKLHAGGTYKCYCVAGNENFVKEKTSKEGGNVFQKASTKKRGR